MTKTEQFNLVANHNPNLYYAFPIEGDDGLTIEGVMLSPVVAWATTTTYANGNYLTETWPVSAESNRDDDEWCVVDLVSGIWSAYGSGQGNGGVSGVKDAFQLRLNDRIDAHKHRAGAS
jgi:hypothetical protein